jgi:hypothetical protein
VAILLSLLGVFFAQLLYFCAMIRGGTTGVRQAERVLNEALSLAKWEFRYGLYSPARFILNKPRENKKVDVVLVYDGDSANIPAGFREATRFHCPRLVFSSMRKAYIQETSKTSHARYSGSVTIVGGASKAGVPTTGVVGGAWTTDQDARLTVPVVKSLLCESVGKKVLLVTSWYHLPRAYFLTRLYLLGSGITLDCVPSNKAPAKWWRSPDLRREFPKFWGSLFRAGLALVGIQNWPRPSGYPKGR